MNRNGIDEPQDILEKHVDNDDDDNNILSCLL